MPPRTWSGAGAEGYSSTPFSALSNSSPRYKGGETGPGSKPGKTAPAGKPNVFARTGTYFHDVRSEMKRVVWPTRAEVLNSSVVVVTTLIFFIVFILIVDQVVIQFLKLIGKLG